MNNKIFDINQRDLFQGLDQSRREMVKHWLDEIRPSFFRKNTNVNRIARFHRQENNLQKIKSNRAQFQWQFKGTAFFILGTGSVPYATMWPDSGDFKYTMTDS